MLHSLLDEYCSSCGCLQVCTYYIGTTIGFTRLADSYSLRVIIYRGAGLFGRQVGGRGRTNAKMNIQNIRRPVTLSRVGRGVHGECDITHHILIIASHVIIIIVVVVVGVFEPRRRHGRRACTYTSGRRFHFRQYWLYAVCERVRANVGKTGQGAGLSAERSGPAGRRRAIPRRPIADDGDDNADWRRRRVTTPARVGTRHPRAAWRYSWVRGLAAAVVFANARASSTRRQSRLPRR